MQDWGTMRHNCFFCIVSITFVNKVTGFAIVNSDKVSDDGVEYPPSLVGPGTHGPDPETVESTTLRINGETYNIKMGVGPVNKRPEGRIGDFDPSSILLTSGSGDGDVETVTLAPVTGAIDYVLIPLIILALTGPMWVIMLIVMATVEFKLPHNVQQKEEERSLNNRKHTYFDLNTYYSKFGLKKQVNTVSDRLKRFFLGGDTGCGSNEKTVCEMGIWVRPMRDARPQLFDNIESNLASLLVPSEFEDLYSIYSASIRREDGDCEEYLKSC